MPLSLCKECGLSVVWKAEWTKTGPKNWQCYDADGITVHWDRCSAERFRKIKATGDQFDYGKEKGYYTELKRSGVQLTYNSSGVIRGEKYHPSGECPSCCPPWEVCHFNCPDRLEIA